MMRTSLLSLTFYVLCYLSCSVLSAFGYRPLPERDAYIVQSLVLDQYINVAEGYQQSAMIQNLHDGSVSRLTTEVYLTASRYGDKPVGLSINVEKVDGVSKVSPLYEIFDSNDDMQGRLKPGVIGNIYRIVTRLGGLNLQNAALYAEESVEGTVFARGLIPDLWQSTVVWQGMPRDPFINDFMQKIVMQEARSGLGTSFKYPGFAGYLSDVYETNLDHFTDNNRVGFNDDMRRTIGSSADKSSILIDTKASQEHYSARDTTAKQRRVEAFEQERINNPYTGSDADIEAGRSPFDNPIFGDDDLLFDPYEDVSSCTHGSKRSLEARQRCRGVSAQDLEKLNGPTSSIETRVGGTLRTFTSVGGRVVGLAGPAGLALLPAFIVLDFVDGDWKAAAWAVGSVAAGVSADAAASGLLGAASIAGPVGLLVGLAVAALFLIIPGLFKPKHEPLAGNVTQIIQWAFFGDATHTGNEKCNQDLQNKGQEPNCTVTYGAGALEGMFDWQPADAAMFPIRMNEGRPMSIPDMAANFTVYDYTNPNASANALAVIDCGTALCTDPNSNPVTMYNAEPAQITCAVTDPAYKCPKPKFKLNRNLITLPVLNQKADVVFDKIESGDCKIVSDPVEGEVIYPPTESGQISPSNRSDAPNLLDYYARSTINDTRRGNSSQLSNSSFGPINGSWSLIPGTTLNYTGKPVSIACNLTANIPDVLSPTYNASLSPIYTSGKEDTSGESNYIIAPPRPVPFKSLTPEEAICLSSSKTPQTLLCFPNGTFPTCQGTFGFTTDKIDTLSFPGAGQTGNLTLDIEQILDSDGVDQTPPPYFTTPLKADAGLQYSIGVATKRKDKFEIMYNQGQAIPKAFCVFSKVNFDGDVFCMGPGGTNLTANLVNRVASLTLGSDLEAILYPKFYGDSLGLRISTNVADLSNLPFNTSESFRGNLAAAWVFEASGNSSFIKK